MKKVREAGTETETAERERESAAHCGKCPHSPSWQSLPLWPSRREGARSEPLCPQSIRLLPDVANLSISPLV
jgi:hypothetical protein